MKPFDAHTQQLFERSGIVKLEKLAELNVQVLAHSLWHDVAPEALTLETKKSAIIQNTRSMNNFDIPHLKNMKLRSLPAYNCLISWNTLPNELKSIATPDAFKSALRNHGGPY